MGAIEQQYSCLLIVAGVPLPKWKQDPPERLAIGHIKYYSSFKAITLPVTILRASGWLLSNLQVSQPFQDPLVSIDLIQRKRPHQSE